MDAKNSFFGAQAKCVNFKGNIYNILQTHYLCLFMIYHIN